MMQKMKHFRSSKNLKPVDPQLKQQCQLRMKVKILEQQILLLQKSNLNIFVPLSEHPVHESIDYQSIINKLRQQILALDQQNQGLKNTVKKLQRQKIQLKTKLQKQISELKNQAKQLKLANQQLTESLEQSNNRYQQKKQQCEKLDKLLIQKNIQLKFLHQDLHQQKIKKQTVQKQLRQLKYKVSQVLYSSRIYKSLEIKCLCIEKQEYDAMKAKIAELQAKIREMIQAGRRQKISLGSKKSDIGEQIVRLKKNIDMQLGIEGNSKHSEQFLKIYKSTHQLFNQLIKKCKN